MREISYFNHCHFCDQQLPSHCHDLQLFIIYPYTMLSAFGIVTSHGRVFYFPAHLSCTRAFIFPPLSSRLGRLKHKFPCSKGAHHSKSLSEFLLLPSSGLSESTASSSAHYKHLPKNHILSRILYYFCLEG